MFNCFILFIMLFLFSFKYYLTSVLLIHKKIWVKNNFKNQYSLTFIINDCFQGTYILVSLPLLNVLKVIKLI